MAKKQTHTKTHLDRTFIGTIKDVVDEKRAGRIRVWIPELESREDDENGWILCNYCSPFGGVTSWKKNNQSFFDRFENTQTAYGMWMIPPDVDNNVVVMIPGGDIGQAIWIGSVFKEFMNHSVPDAAYSDNNKQFFGESKKIPVTEYNKWDTTGDAQDPLSPVRPYHKTRFDAIAEQGLIADEVRGITSSSSMRETPSQVFGINTPGPKSTVVDGARDGGHSFIMDDGDEEGNDSYIGFKTKSGASIRIDDANGLIYAVNTKGTSWIQMDADGNVDIFGAESISMRTQKDFNVRADGDINLEAGKNVNVKAAQNTDAEGKVAADGTGEGGDINMQALNDMNILVDDNVKATVTKGNVDIDVQGEESGELKVHVKGKVDITLDDSIVTNVANNVDLEAGGYIHNTAGADYTFTGNNATLDTPGNLLINGTLDVGGVANFAADILVAANGQFGGAVSCSALVTGALSVGAAAAAASASAAASGGDSVIAGIIYATDFQTPTIGLLAHTHIYAPGPLTPVATAPGVGGGGSGTAPTSPAVTPPDAPEPPAPVAPAATTPSSAIATTTSKNVLLEFDGTIAMNLNNDNVKASASTSTVDIPDYWNRTVEDVESIVGRLMTYEPCPAHINRGNQE